MHNPAISIQIKLLFAAESYTARLSLGSNRNPANIRAATTVPRIPAIFPNRTATSRIIPKKTRGKKVRNELVRNRGIKEADAMVQVTTPSDAPMKRFTAKEYREFRADSPLDASI